MKYIHLKIFLIYIILQILVFKCLVIWTLKTIIKKCVAGINTLNFPYIYDLQDIRNMHDIHNVFMYVANNTPNIKKNPKRKLAIIYVILVINVIITLLTNLPFLHHKVFLSFAQKKV